MCVVCGRCLYYEIKSRRAEGERVGQADLVSLVGQYALRQIMCEAKKLTHLSEKVQLHLLQTRKQQKKPTQKSEANIAPV